MGSVCIVNVVLSCRLKVGVMDQVLQGEASRARKLCGQKLSLEGFAEYVNLPVTETLQDMFALFEEVGFYVYCSYD